MQWARRMKRCILFAVAACTTGPSHQQEIISTQDPIPFTGYTLSPGSRLHVDALNQATGAWETVATTISSSTVSIAENSWGGNPPLYAWNAQVPAASGCYYTPTCQLPTGNSYGVSTLHLRVQDSDGSNLLTFTSDFGSCMGQRINAGRPFTGAATDCVSWTYPEIQLRYVGEWQSLPQLPVISPPAVGGSRLSLSVAVSDAATVRVATKAALADAPAWTTLTGAPPTGMATATAPVIAVDRAETTRRLIARANDGRVFTTTLGQTALRPLPIGNGATGRLAMALANGSTTYVVHASASSMVDFWRLDGADPATAIATNVRFAGLEGTVAALDDQRAIVAVRNATSVNLWLVQRGQPSSLLGTLRATRVDDISDVAIYGGGFHVAVATVDAGVGRVQHVAGAVGAPLTISQVTTYAVGADPANVALSVLHTRGVRGANSLPGVAIAHGHLVVAWRDALPGVHTARWERTSSTPAWVLEATVGATSRLAGRPALADVDMAEYSTGAMRIGYSSDVFAVTLDANRVVRLADLTRAMQRRNVERYFELFQASQSLCANDATTPATWLPDLARDNRPILSSLGSVLWTLPSWFLDEPLVEGAAVACRAGARQPAIAATQRACELEKVAISVQPTATIFVCPEGMNLNHDTSITGAWSELGHLTASMIGLRDGATQPTAHDADVADIPFAALQQAWTMFGVPPTCDHALYPRCPGFATWYDSAGAPSRQHSFVEAMSGYMFWGDTLRAQITADQAPGSCNDLLAQKYLWIRTNIFRGLEFDDRGEPTPPRTISLCSR